MKEINICVQSIYLEGSYEVMEVIHINDKCFPVTDSYTLYDSGKIYHFRMGHGMYGKVFNHDCYGWQIDIETISLLQAYKVI